MIGQTIEQEQKTSQWWAFWLLVGAVLIAVELVVGAGHFGMIALAPLALGFVLLLSRRKPFIMRVEEEGLNVVGPLPQFIEYEHIEMLPVHDEGNTGDSFAFDIVHGKWALAVPAQLNVPSMEVWDFLKGRMPPAESGRIPAALHSFKNEQELMFGVERVFSFRAVPKSPFAPCWFGVLMSAAMIVVGISWLIFGAQNKRNEVWTGIGGMAVFVGFISLLITFINRANKRHRRGSSTGVGGLVITPTGFALQQGDMKGKMRWDEIASVVFGDRAQNITIRFAGGSFIIKDIFNAQPRTIYHLLMDYWKGPGRDYSE